MTTEKRLDLVEREAVKDAIGFMNLHFLGHGENKSVLDSINDVPTVDAAPVVHSHWEKTIDNCTVMHKCSVCGARVVKGFYEYENPNRYCYHCGAKMDGEKDSYGHNADKRDTVTYNGVVLPEPPKMDGERKDND